MALVWPLWWPARCWTQSRLTGFAGGCAKHPVGGRGVVTDCPEERPRWPAAAHVIWEAAAHIRFLAKYVQRSCPLCKCLRGSGHGLVSTFPLHSPLTPVGDSGQKEDAGEREGVRRERGGMEGGGGGVGRRRRCHLPIGQTSKPRLCEVEGQAEGGSDGQWQGWDQAIGLLTPVLTCPQPSILSSSVTARIPPHRSSQRQPQCQEM